MRVAHEVPSEHRGTRWLTKDLGVVMPSPCIGGSRGCGGSSEEPKSNLLSPSTELTKVSSHPDSPPTQTLWPLVWGGKVKVSLNRSQKCTSLP